MVCVCRLPTLLLRDSSGDVQEGDELAGNADFSPRSSHFREGKGSYSQVQFAPLALLNIYSTFYQNACESPTGFSYTIAGSWWYF